MPRTGRANLKEYETTTHMCLLKKENIFIPKAADLPKLSILVVAHCGEAGHHARQITHDRVRNYFTWVNLEDEINTFCSKCIH